MLPAWARDFDPPAKILTKITQHSARSADTYPIMAGSREGRVIL